MSQFTRLANALHVDCAARFARDRVRPDHTAALDLDFYSLGEAPRPSAEQRYCVAQFEWRAGGWRRVRKLSGPMQFGPALDQLATHLKRTGFPHVRDA